MHDGFGIASWIELWRGLCPYHPAIIVILVSGRAIIAPTRDLLFIVGRYEQPGIASTVDSLPLLTGMPVLHIPHGETLLIFILFSCHLQGHAYDRNPHQNP